jgi:hypothetical protein
VVYRCEGDLRPDPMAEILEHGTIEVLGIVDRDLLWNSIAANNVLPKEFFMVAEVTLETGFTSTHLVKYSTAKMTKV